MNRFALTIAAVAVMVCGRVSLAQYGDISDVKLNKPEDKQDVASTPPPPGAVVLFDGKSLDGWARADLKVSEGGGEAKPAAWKLLDPAAAAGAAAKPDEKADPKVAPKPDATDAKPDPAVAGAMEVHGGDIMTRQTFGGHFKLHVEFRVPYMPKASGQGRGNSGVYLQGRYEVQVLDSYGIPKEKYQENDCGSIYSVAVAKENACKAPTVWQSYDIEFWAPKCEGGKKTAPGRITVVQNGVTIHQDQPITKDNTTSGMGGDPCKPGPIMLQDHGNPVQYRNIWLVKLDD